MEKQKFDDAFYNVFKQDGCVAIKTDNDCVIFADKIYYGDREIICDRNNQSIARIKLKHVVEVY